MRWLGRRSACQGNCRQGLPYILLGIALGADIHGYVPEDFFLISFMGKDVWWAVPLGVPMYANAAGIIPIVAALSWWVPSRSKLEGWP